MLKLKKIKPLFTNIVTTMDTYEDDVRTAGGLIDTTKQKGVVKEYQTVLSVGDCVRNIKEGDIVCINPTRFAKVQHKSGSLQESTMKDNPVLYYKFDTIDINDKQCLLLQDRDINFIIDEYEEIPDPAPSPIIHPAKKSIIL